MKPLGRKSSRFPSKKDFHPPKGWVNWWEVDISESGNKAREKEKTKKEIEEELKENDK